MAFFCEAVPAYPRPTCSHLSVVPSMGWFAFFMCLVLSLCKDSIRSPRCDNVCFCCWMYCYRWWQVDQNSIISHWELNRRWALCHSDKSCVHLVCMFDSSHMKCIIFAPFLLVCLFRGWIWGSVVSWSTGDCREIYFQDPTLNLQSSGFDSRKQSALPLHSCGKDRGGTEYFHETGVRTCGAALLYNSNVVYNLILIL